MLNEGSSIFLVVLDMPKVKVDWNKCNGDGVCVEVCPVDVFELQKLHDYPDTDKSVPVRENECILCMACTAACPTQAITVEE
ncbi:ferredoxin family protein [Candidatus Bathyarchaeota archaeon]|nr:ferredoxin family protein [Candidatus Bathyarchaeota archaeon]